MDFVSWEILGAILLLTGDTYTCAIHQSLSEFDISGGWGSLQIVKGNSQIRWKRSQATALFVACSIIEVDLRVLAIRSRTALLLFKKSFNNNGRYEPLLIQCTSRWNVTSIWPRTARNTCCVHGFPQNSRFYWNTHKSQWLVIFSLLPDHGS